MTPSFVFNCIGSPAALREFWTTPGMMRAHLIAEGCPEPTGNERTMRKFSRSVVASALLRTLETDGEVFDAADVTFYNMNSDSMVEAVMITAGDMPALYIGELAGFPLRPWPGGSITIVWDNGPERIVRILDPKRLHRKNQGLRLSQLWR